MDSNATREDSPTAKQRKTPSLPIARNSGSAYERQERARTSHACEPCRERKTKCDGERPSCHRCLHTGTGCHYGYGKGWRKRKTAEDLNATSRKLQIYEALLSSIYSQVDNEVQAQIDEARSQDLLNLGTPESVDSASSMSTGMHLTSERDQSMSGASNRLPLPLPQPVPNTLMSQGRAPPALVMPFDRVSSSASPHLAHHPKREGGYEDGGTGRLPSITPQGLLIEEGLRDASPNYHAAAAFSPPGMDTRTERLSPTSLSPHHDLTSRTGWSIDFVTGVHDTDKRPSLGATASALTIPPSLAT